MYSNNIPLTSADLDFIAAEILPKMSDDCLPLCVGVLEIPVSSLKFQNVILHNIFNILPSRGKQTMH